MDETPTTSPTANRRQYPTLPESLLLLLIGWASGYAAATLSDLFLDGDAVTAIGNTVGIGAAVWTGCRLARKPLAETLMLRPFPLRLMPLLAIMATSGTILGAELANWVHRIIPLPEVFQEVFSQLLLAGTWLEFLQKAALLSLMAPITEELLFRGVIQQGLIGNYGLRKGIVAASVCFGIFHLIPWQIVGVTFVGLLLGVVVHRTGSIFAGMWLHGVWNLLPLVAFTVARLMNAHLVLQGFEPGEDAAQHLPLGVLIPCAAVFVLAMRRFLNVTSGMISKPEVGGVCDDLER